MLNCPFGVNVCVYGSFRWAGVPFRKYFYLTPRVHGQIYSDLEPKSMVTMNETFRKIKLR